MNDYRAAEEIISSLIRDSDEERMKKYISCALAMYCYKVGLSYPILSAAFEIMDLKQQLHVRDRLPLCWIGYRYHELCCPG